MVTIIINGMAYTFENEYDLIELLDEEADIVYDTNEPDGIEWGF